MATAALPTESRTSRHAGFRVEQAGVLIDLGIVPEFRFGGMALRTVIRYA
jgi:hypothetical protein